MRLHSFRDYNVTEQERGLTLIATNTKGVGGQKRSLFRREKKNSGGGCDDDFKMGKRGRHRTRKERGEKPRLPRSGVEDQAGV